MKTKILTACLVLCMLSTGMPVSVAAGGNELTADTVEQDMPEREKNEVDREISGNSSLAGDCPMDEEDICSAEINEDIEECEEIESDGSPIELRAGQMTSFPAFYGNGNTAAAITSNGALYCWGDNGYGVVGNGSSEDYQSTPVKVLDNVTSVSCDNRTMAAVTGNGDLYCWGDNDYGEVGDGSFWDQSTPVKVLSNVTFVSVFRIQDGHVMAAITSNGELYCWGYNGNGEVGNGSFNIQGTPVKVLNNVTSLSVFHTYDENEGGYDGGTMAAITGNGDLYCWGKNTFGRVGNGNFENQNAPVKVLSDVASISDSRGTVTAITNNGDLYCWGDNTYGQIGNGDFKTQNTPVKVLSDVASISAFGDQVAAITNNRDLYCWGNNAYGQMQNIPVKVLSNVTSISKHGDTMAATTSNGDLYCWGNNTYGGEGNGDFKDQIAPVKVLSNVTSVSEYGVMAAITDNGDLYCWGHNEYGQVGNGNFEEQGIPVKVLSNVTFVSEYNGTVAAITGNEDLYCWGYNEYGQVGNGSFQNQSVPVKVLSDVASVSKYANIMAAITNNGDLYCWGYNEYGQVGNGSTADQAVPVKILNLVAGGLPDEDIVDKGDGSYAEWKLTSDGVLTINSGNMSSYLEEAPWKKYAEMIRKVILCEGVKAVGAKALKDCTFLTDIEICSDLESDYKDSIDDIIHIPTLENIIVSENSEKLSSLDGVLYNKEQTELIGYPRGRKEKRFTVPSGVKTLGSRAFGGWGLGEGSANLKEIILSDSVTKIGMSTFENCFDLEIVTYSAGSKAGAESFIDEGAFRNCRKLRKVTIPEGCSSIGSEAFCGCGKLSGITIPGSCSWIGVQTFYGCGSLTSIIIPASVKEIEVGAFRECKNLKSIFIFNKSCRIVDFDRETMDDDSDDYYEFCEQYDPYEVHTNSTICEATTIYGYPKSTAQTYAKKFRRKFIAFPVKGTKVKNTKTKDIYIIQKTAETAAYAGTYKKNAKSVAIPSKVTISGITYKVTVIANNAFKNNRKLKKVTIPDTIETIGASAFQGCTAIKNITIPGNVESIGKNAFCNCRKMNSIVIRSKKLVQKKVGNRAFTKTGSIKYKKLIVKVPPEKYSAYKKILRKKGLSAKVKVKKAASA